MSESASDYGLRHPAQMSGASDLLVSVKPVAVCLLIGGLEFRGAERQVVEMMRTFDRSRVRPILCSLSTTVPLADALRDRAEIFTSSKTRAIRLHHRLSRCLSASTDKIDIVHAFLFDSEIVARLAAPLADVRVVVSSERNTDYSRRLLHRIALTLTRPLFDVMVANSHAGKQFNIRTQGLAPSRIEVVYNGVDTERFHPNREAGLAFRRRLGIAPDAPVVVWSPAKARRATTISCAWPMSSGNRFLPQPS